MAATQASPSQGLEADWNTLGMDMNLDMDDGGILDSAFDIQQSDFGLPPLGPSLPTGDLYSQELLGLGLQEPLPPQDMMDELWVYSCVLIYQ